MEDVPPLATSSPVPRALRRRWAMLGVSFFVFFFFNGLLNMYILKDLGGLLNGERQGKASMKPEKAFFDENGPRFVQKGLPQG